MRWPIRPPPPAPRRARTMRPWAGRPMEQAAAAARLAEADGRRPMASPCRGLGRADRWGPRSYRPWYEAQPQNPRRSWHLMGVCLKRAGRAGQGPDVLERAAKMAPSDVSSPLAEPLAMCACLTAITQAPRWPIARRGAARRRNRTELWRPARGRGASAERRGEAEQLASAPLWATPSGQAHRWRVHGAGAAQGPASWPSLTRCSSARAGRGAGRCGLTVTVACQSAAQGRPRGALELLNGVIARNSHPMWIAEFPSWPISSATGDRRGANEGVRPPRRGRARILRAASTGGSTAWCAAATRRDRPYRTGPMPCPAN